MKHIRKFNEDNKLEFEDLVLLFAEISDDNLSTYHNRGIPRGEQFTHNRQIAITIGEYFRSNPFLLKDIITPQNERDSENRERVLKEFERNKPFEINIQINSGDKLNDMIHVLEWVRNNKDQIEYFGYQFEDFYLAKQRYFDDWAANLLTVKYVPKK